MKRQKRVAVINDVTGFGRCSAAVAQPIISAMKIQCCVFDIVVNILTITVSYYSVCSAAAKQVYC